MVKLQPILENWVLDVADGALNIYMTHTVTLILLRTVYFLFFLSSFTVSSANSIVPTRFLLVLMLSISYVILHLRTPAASFKAILLVL